MMKKIFYLFLVIYLFTSNVYSEDIKVGVGIAPIKNIVEKICKNNVNIIVMAEKGQEAHTYSPTPSKLIKASNISIYFKTGLEFEDILLKKLININKHIKIVDLSKYIKSIKNNPQTHTHEKNSDPHIWMSAINLKLISRVILETIIKEDLKNKQEYINNYKEFNLNIIDTEIKILKLIGINKNINFLIFHPSLSYFSRDYGLNQISIEHEGKEPGPGDIKDIIDLTRTYKINYIFLDSQFNATYAKKIADILKVKIIEFSVLEEDVLNNLYKIAEKISKISGNNNE